MKKKAKIHYFTLTDQMRKEEKLTWFRENKLKDIPFQTIHPDKNNNWVDLVDNDFESFLPLQEKRNRETVFAFSTLGVSTNRDAWVYDVDKKNLLNKIKFFIDKYNSFLKKKDTSWNVIIKWSAFLKNMFKRNKRITFQTKKIIQANYRPFTKIYFYSEKLLNDRLTQNHYDIFGKELDKENKIIVWASYERKSFSLFSTAFLPNLNFYGDPAYTISLYRYDASGNRIENITDWGLKQFQNHYQNDVETGHALSLRTRAINKADIFHYTYGVLHNPAYRKKYELNLKREFPRLPFYADFDKWVAWGKELMDLHINYESVEPYQVKLVKNKIQKTHPKAKLSRNKDTNELVLDENTSLTGIPKIAFDYKLGNRSALDWILDQYKEKKPRDKTIAEKFNTYRFADYKKTVIDLLKRVATVSVKTMEIANQMEAEEKHQTQK